MKLLIDADACPVIRIAVTEAERCHIPCLLFCDTSHSIAWEGAETITVSKGSDSADFALIRRIEPGDLVITQDYGLAALSLTKTPFVLDQNGRFYTQENIDGLLEARYAAQKIRMGGGRLKGPKARTTDQDQAFLMALRQFLHTHAFSD